jgi:hypothetical protein
MLRFYNVLLISSVHTYLAAGIRKVGFAVWRCLVLAVLGGVAWWGDAE